MVSNDIYVINKPEIGVSNKIELQNGITPTEEKIYEYEDAIDLTGNGWYNRGLLTALSIGLLGMGIDMFGFSVIVTGCSCDFQLELWQQSIMLSMPFVGPILMSIAWGYISDTRGRRKVLLIALWGSFLASIISAFSVNWIMLTVLKIISSSFCSTIQSGAYALLGESCSTKVRGFYMLIMTSVLMLFLLSYVVPGYFILHQTFSINLVFINFTPWRLLAIVLAAPLGISGFMLHFFYESPKFLVNVGRQKEALENLEKIWVRNGGNVQYPVCRVVLKEDAKIRDENISFIESLIEQTIPLFKPPLLWRTLQLFFITAVIYSINNSLVMWMPYIVEAFTVGVNTDTSEESRSLCNIIMSITSQQNSTNDESVNCISAIHSRTLLSGITHGVVFAGITLAVSKLASRKKAMMIIFLLIPLLSSLAAIFNQNNVASLLLFVGMMMTNLCMGVLFAFYVELYPTSYRGMAACLGVMVARISGLAGVNFLGRFITTHCTMTFYAFSALLLSGIFVAAYFLPSRTQSKWRFTKTNIFNVFNLKVC